MTVSVLIAAYKAGGYITRALGSVRAQTHSDWELVVVEDGSHDSTEQIVAQFSTTVTQSVRYENLGLNRGVATARTRLLELARGEAIAFLDADDWWTPGHLAEAASAFGGGADVVVSGIQLYDLDVQKPLGTYNPPATLVTDPVRVLFCGSAIMTSSSVALRRTTTHTVGAFDAQLRIGEDRDYWLRCAQAGAHFALTGTVSCFYAKHSSSTMAKTLLWAEQAVLFHEKHRELEAVEPGLRRRRLAHELVNYGRLVRAQDPAASRQALARAFQLAPSLRTLAYYVRSSLG